MVAVAGMAGTILSLGLTSAEASTATAKYTVVKSLSLYSIACPSSAACVAVGSVAGKSGTFNAKDVVLNTATGSAKTGPSTLKDIAQPVSVACPDKTTCIGVVYGEVIRVSMPSGAMRVVGRIKPPKGDTAFLDTISCAGKVCWAGGDVESQSSPQLATLVKISDTGKVLSQRTIKTKVTLYQSITCETSTVCLGLVSGLKADIVKLVNGKTTATHPLPVAFTVPVQVYCYGSKLCYAMGSYPFENVLYSVSPSTGKLGKKLSTGRLNGDGLSGGNTPVACSSATQCVVNGSDNKSGDAASVTVAKGRVGKIVDYAHAGLGPFVAGACASSARCYAVGPELDSGNVVGSFIVRI